jgi:acetyl esterase/lipase
MASAPPTGSTRPATIEPGDDTTVAAPPPGRSSRLSRRALLGASAVGAAAWTVNRSTGLIGWLSTLDTAGASSTPATATSSTATTSPTTVASAALASSPAVSAVSELAPSGAATQLVYTPPTASRAFGGLLVRPASTQRPTAIVLVHGGGATGGSQADSASWSDWYRDHGYLTFSIDYRLVDPATDTGIYPIPEQNVKAAVQYLRQHADELGIERIVVQGHSAGARLAGIAATTADLPAFSGREVWDGVSDRIEAMIGFYGYYDGAQYQDVAYYGGDGSAPRPRCRPAGPAR